VWGIDCEGLFLNWDISCSIAWAEFPKSEHPVNEYFVLIHHRWYSTHSSINRLISGEELLKLMGYHGANIADLENAELTELAGNSVSFRVIAAISVLTLEFTSYRNDVNGDAAHEQALESLAEPRDAAWVGPKRDEHRSKLLIDILYPRRLKRKRREPS